MKRFVVVFDDGEILESFDTLEEAKACRSRNNWRYISRYLQVYDRKEKKTVIG